MAIAASKLSPFLVISKRPPIYLLILQFSASTYQNHSSATAATRRQNLRHLIADLGTAGKTQEMTLLLNEMVRFRYPDAQSSFQSLVESFCRQRRPKEALSVFEVVASAKFRLSISACNALLSSLVEERFDLGNVVFVYKEMVKGGVLPTVDTLNWLIKGLVADGKIELALDQFGRMEKKNCVPNCETFRVLISGFCSCGRIDEAVGIWKKMLEIGCSRDIEFYRCCIPLFCRACRLDEAMNMFALMKSEGFSPDLELHSALIQCLCESLRMDDAVEVFEEMCMSGFTPVTRMYVDVVNGYCKMGEFSEAVTFLEENGVVSDTEPYNALLQGFCDGGRIREATSYLKKIWEMGMGDSRSWNILTECLCKKANVGRAFEVLGRMIVSSYSPDERTYSAIVTGFCKMCSYDSALEWFRQGIIKGMCPELESCSELVKGLCRMEKVEEAVDVFNCIISEGGAVDSDAVSTLIRGLCLRRKVREAIKLRSVALCNGIASTPLTYEILMLGLLDSNNGKNIILPLLSQVLVEGCTLDYRTYHILIRGLCHERTCWNAAVLFNQMVQDGIVPDNETLEMIVKSALKCSQLHLVLHSFDTVIEGGGLTSPSVCNTIVYGLVKEGRRHEARRFLDWMLEKGWVPDSNTHGLLVGSVDEEGKDEAQHEDGDEVSSILSEGLRDSS